MQRQLEVNCTETKQSFVWISWAWNSCHTWNTSNKGYSS